MDLTKYLKMPNEKLDDDILKKLKENKINKLNFFDLNTLLTNTKSHFDCGYQLVDDGIFPRHYLISIFTPLVGVTKEMVDWWFWWHAQDSLRYQAWYPGKHLKISYDKANEKYFKAKSTPVFENNTHYPKEKISKLGLPLKIDFVKNEEFGFKTTNNKNVATILTANVSAFKGLIKNTKMTHIFFNTDNGLYLVSRFFLGINLNNKVLNKLIITKKQARDMAFHCAVEYRNFAKRIPLIYSEYLKEKEAVKR